MRQQDYDTCIARGHLRLDHGDCILATSLWVSQNALPCGIYRYQTQGCTARLYDSTA